MKIYDMAIFWEWNYDVPFNDLLKRHASLHNINLLFVDPSSINSTKDALRNKEMKINWILDRASETDEKFLPLIKICSNLKIKSVNPFTYVRKALNKAYIQRKLEQYELPLPETLILPAFNKKEVLPFINFEDIGVPFVVKPSSEGGGEGVNMGVTELSQIKTIRQQYPEQEYLIQQTIEPKIITKCPLWIRGYFSGGDVHLIFWHPKNKTFHHIIKDDISLILQSKIKDMLRSIAMIAKINLFSTEIAITNDNRPVLIDYVNDPIDFRPLSMHVDGIPDELLEKIIVSLLRLISG